MPLLLAKPNGSKTIINVTSLASNLAGKGTIGFNICALATNRLTEDVAAKYNCDGVMVYAVHPRAVWTTPPPGMPPQMEDFSKDELGLCGVFILWWLREKRKWLSGRYLSATWDVE